MKSIFRFLAILAVGVGFYFYQEGLPEDLPFIKQEGQVIETQTEAIVKTPTSVPTTSIQTLQPEPLEVKSEFIADQKDSTILSVSGVIEFTNKARASEAKASLVMNEQLNASAKVKVADMFKSQYFQHDSPSGVTMSDLIEEAGYEYITIGENLALGDFKDDEALVTAWMNSPGHRANILNSNYTEIGVAVGHGFYNGSETWLAVQHFGRPKNLCSGIDEALKVSIEANKAKIETLAQELNLNDGGVTTIITTVANQDKVKEYNNLIEIVSKEIEVYNTQVTAFNTCISVQ